MIGPQALRGANQAALLGVLSFAAAERSAVLALLGCGAVVLFAWVQRLSWPTAPVDFLLGSLFGRGMTQVSEAERGRGHGVSLFSRRVINLLLIVGVVWTALRLNAVDARDTSPVVSILSSLVVWLTVIRLLEAKTTRNVAQILALSCTLAVGACLTGVSMQLGICLLAYLVVFLRAVMLYQIESTRARAGTPMREDESDRSRESRRTPSGGLSRVLVLCVPIALLGAGFVFAVMPRTDRPNLAAPGGTGSGPGSTVSFADTIELGSVWGTPTASPEVVLEVRVLDRGRVPAPSRSYLLRGAVLDLYRRVGNTGKWTSSAAATEFDLVDQNRRFLQSPPSDVELGSLITQEILIRDRDKPFLFSVLTPVGLYAEQASEISRYQHNELTSELIYKPDPRSGVGGRIRYTVYSDPRAVATGEVLEAIEATAPQEHRVFKDTRIADLTREVLANAGVVRDFEQRHTPEDFRIARLIQDYLWRTCTYTLDQERLEGDVDPIEHFLFERREGHCEYFASAMVAMCRSVGVNARGVTGYIATERSPTGDTFLVRRAHAHAWAEVETEPGVWSTFDASPPTQIASLHRPAGIRATLRRYMDQVELVWIDYVTAYDREARARLFDRIFGENAVERLSDFGNRTAETALARWPFAAALLGFMLVIAGLRRLVRTFGFARRRRLARELREAFADAPDAGLLAKQAAFYAELLQLLESLGHRKPESLPVLDHARALEPTLREQVGPLARLYYQIRFAHRALTDRQTHEVEQRLAALRAWRPDR